MGTLSITRLSFVWWDAAKMTRTIKCMRFLELCTSRIECISFTGAVRNGYLLSSFKGADDVDITALCFGVSCRGL
ncbi:hypothetical protein BOTCAL_0409g00060 [Botryotinia calthae]|uniref:Uncharacterized protein n=1 Tax=Botryotinia calthae TaxID=38488 RepID=A0A4Y8CPX7_9HELO|nr:hypothetical protein BOTCAL_0409g00060 [Botryotinia calthae]